MNADLLMDAIGQIDEATAADAKFYTRTALPARPRARRLGRIALLAAVVSLLFTVSAYALGTPAGIFSWSQSKGYGQDRFESLPYYAKQIGFPVLAVKEFSNGYRFREMRVTHSAIQDADFNAMDQFLGLNLEYSKEGAPDLALHIDPEAYFPVDSSAPVTASREIGGVTVNYYRSIYRAVPEDYEKTPEDEARIAAGDLTISYGSDTMEEMVITSSIFRVNGCVYDLFCFCDYPADDLFQMAAELLDAA